MPTRKLKIKSTPKGIKITCKNATISQIKNAFDHFIYSSQKTKNYKLKKL